MKRLIFLTFLFLGFLVFTSDANASLLVIDSEGKVVWNVLSAEDSLALGIAERGDIEIKSVAVSNNASSIALKKQDGKLFLNDLDVTNWNDSLVEIEERGVTQKITIGTQGDQFTIEQNGVVAMTTFPINIRPKENELSLTTSSGSVFLSILPIEAAESALRSRFMSRIPDKIINISEQETGLLAYSINGEKVIDFLNLYEYPIPVTAVVSASTGEILSVEGPQWFKIFGFLFS